MAREEAMVVLIVDDSVFFRRIVKDILQAEGYVCLEASSGREAVGLYRGWAPDVVLLDYCMPEMDGIETLKALRQLDSQAHVVMCSDLCRHDVILEAIRAGAKDFIAKPISRLRLNEAIARLMPASSLVARKCAENPSDNPPFGGSPFEIEQVR